MKNCIYFIIITVEHAKFCYIFQEIYTVDCRLYLYVFNIWMHYACVAYIQYTCNFTFLMTLCILFRVLTYICWNCVHVNLKFKDESVDRICSIITTFCEIPNILLYTMKLLQFTAYLKPSHLLLLYIRFTSKNKNMVHVYNVKH